MAPVISIVVRDEFEDKKALKKTLMQLAVFTHFEYTTVKSNKTILTVKCKNDECPWRLYASNMQDGVRFSIRTFEDEHTCYGLNSIGNQQASATFVASLINEKVQQNPDLKPCQIKKDIQTEYGVEISYQVAFRAKDLATAEINGSHESGYQALPKYCRDLEETNPGSVISFELLEDHRFRRVFTSLHAAIEGFQFCRLLLGIDGAHIRTKYQ